MKDSGDTACSTRGSILIPSWCAHWRGSSAMLLVAPHGGRRAPVNPLAPPPDLRVNDIYTAEIARTLARELRAGAIINGSQDRNLLDLNRTSQVRQRARWYLELLVREIEGILLAHDGAEVIIVHGWNTGQPRCDVGVGAVETAGGLYVPAGAGLTVSREYLGTHLARLRANCARAGITASLGARYPASHQNNLLQLFTAHDRHPDDALVRQISAWAAGGRLNAWQLELGIPLRWPGEWRDRFVKVMLETCGGPDWSPAPGAGPPSAAPRTRNRRQDAPSAPKLAAPRPTALQLYDPAACLGMFAGVGPMRPGMTAGRLLFFLGGQRIALFTGEEKQPRSAAVAPLAFAWRDGRLRVDFNGPMLLLEDAATYLDLEVALANSRLVDVAAALEFRPTIVSGETEFLGGSGGGTSPPWHGTKGKRGRGACLEILPDPPFSKGATGTQLRLSTVSGAGGIQFGDVGGIVTLDGRQRRVQAAAFANAGILRARGSTRQSMISATFDDGWAVLSRAAADASDATVLCFAGHGLRRLGGARIVVTTNGDEYLPDLLELICDGEATLQASPLSRMVILRAIGGGRYLRVAFGVARCRWGQRQGYGLYEYARPLPAHH